MYTSDSSKMSMHRLNNHGVTEYRDNEGRLHRDDGPAVIEDDGYEAWYQHGLRHRDNEPARYWANGTKEWYRYGHKHRDGAPAVTYQDGTEIWYQLGRRHRIDGPAYIDNKGNLEFWLDNNKIYSWQEFQRRANLSEERIMVLTLIYGDLNERHL